MTEEVKELVRIIKELSPIKKVALLLFFEDLEAGNELKPLEAYIKAAKEKTV